MPSLGILGFGRIGRAVYEYATAAPDVTVDYVFVRGPREGLAAEHALTDPAELAERPVDLCVEAATPEALVELAPSILAHSDVAVLSGSAFADRDDEATLVGAAEANDTRLWLPHAALFGIDGIVDAGDTLQSLSIVATKAPDHLDFGYTDEYDPAITERTVLYEGAVRGLCRHFPRNFNSHAAVAMAGPGLDDTTSTLVADPAATTAHHVITAEGDGYTLEAIRDSAIEGVTGDYTLVSTWGSVRRILDLDGAVAFV